MTHTPADTPGAAAAAASSDVIAVVSQSGPTVTFFDAATHQRLDVLQVPPQPHELCFDADRRLLYCTSAYASGYYDSNTGRAREVSVIDADARKIVEVIDLGPDHGPHGLALDRARGRLYVSVEATETEPGGVVVLDADTRERTGRIATMAPGPHWFAITPDGRRGYATNKEAPFVSVVDLDRDEFAGRIEVPGSEGLAVSPDGAFVYAATPKADFAAPGSGPSSVCVIDTATDAVVRTLPVEGAAVPVHITGTGTLLVGELRPPAAPSGTRANGTLAVFTPADLAAADPTPSARIEVGLSPLTITSSPDGRLAYVSNIFSGTVSVIDLTRLAVLTTLEVDRTTEAGAHGLAYIPAAPRG